MTVYEQQWRPLAQELADKLTAGGPAVRRALAETPRHVFAPTYYTHDREGYHRLTEADPRWLEGVYADEALPTQITDTALGPRGTSSSSEPSLMAAMLEDLDLIEGTRVLEIGTGTGYNVALLCALVGDTNVTSVDIDPDLVAAARLRLADLGHHPALVAGDGTKGYPKNAPYDRVIATHAVERVPYAWVAQARPGGIILVDVRSVGAPHIGHLARLTVNEDGTATGDFRTATPGFFMPDRGDLDQPHYTGLTAFDIRDATTRPTRLDAYALDEPGFALWVWSRVPDLTLRRGPTTSLSTPDGSWVLVSEPDAQVQVAGLRDLWRIVEETHAAWDAAGRPRVADYTITITRQGQRIGTHLRADIED